LQEVSVGEIVTHIERVAPPGLAESWDRCGLAVGEREMPVRRVLVALDPSAAAVNEALRRSASLLVTHHPLFLSPLSRLDWSTPVGKRIQALTKADIALYSAHTTLDKATGGVNDALAKALGLADVVPFGAGEALCKIVVTVPPDHALAVREAMEAAGAGRAGRYGGCFFAGLGEGSFRPEAGANPYVGRVGALEVVEESRVETLVSAGRVEEVVAACRAAHPYEEPAIDVYALEGHAGVDAMGRVGELKTPLPLRVFAEEAMDRLGAPGARLVGEESSGAKEVRRIALLGGSGGEVWREARRAGADLLVTGEARYHTACDATEEGFPLLEVGHDVSERVVLDSLAAGIEAAWKEMGGEPDVEIFRESGPYLWMLGRGA